MTVESSANNGREREREREVAERGGLIWAWKQP